jgi:hypothetical protein
LPLSKRDFINNLLSFNIICDLALLIHTPL